MTLEFIEYDPELAQDPKRRLVAYTRSGRPITVPRFTRADKIPYFISTWMCEKDDIKKQYDAKVKIIDPTGAEIGNFSIEFVIEPPDGSRTHGIMKTLLYTVDGTYWLEVYLTEDEDCSPVAHIPIEILHTRSESESQHTL